MELDYIGNINEYGDNIVRLYNFDMLQANKFREVLNKFISEKNETLDLTTVDFIQERNCNLTLRVSEEDLGIITDNNKLFFCDMTIKGYQKMILLLDPFCKKETKGFQWLYDVDSSTDLLFSPAGTW